MKILFCSQCSLTKNLGAAKVLIELAEELEQLGWTCKTLCPSDLAASQGSKKKQLNCAEMLRRYLHEHAAEYDVVDYDHNYLPYPRAEFHSHTLFVARSVLLAHHFENIAIPVTRSWKFRIRSIIMGRIGKNQRWQSMKHARTTINEADFINVANDDDKNELVREGIPENKIVVIPYGISRSRRHLFDAVSSVPPPKPKVAFVGTFDNRKGATDFPEIVQNICDEVPGASFRLVGTAGLYRTQAEILAKFPKKLRDTIEVIPQFSADDLPGLLASCSVGIFPSYIEGFGFGVLEMLAASIPVIAYNSPGPPMMLPPEYLVVRGDAKGMSEKVINLLTDKTKLNAARAWAKQQSQKFCWQHIAKQTSQIYLDHWRRKQTV